MIEYSSIIPGSQRTMDFDIKARSIQRFQLILKKEDPKITVSHFILTERTFSSLSILVFSINITYIYIPALYSVPDPRNWLWYSSPRFGPSLLFLLCSSIAFRLGTTRTKHTSQLINQLQILPLLSLEHFF